MKRIKQLLKQFVNDHYEGLFSHHGLTKNDEGAKKILLIYFGMAILFPLLFILFLIFKDSKFVLNITNESQLLYNFIIIALVYLSAFLASNFFYHFFYYISIQFRTCKLFYYIFYLICFLVYTPWVFLVWIVKKILNLTQILDLYDYLPVLTLIYFVALSFFLLSILPLDYLLDNLFTKFEIYNQYITSQTCLYIVVFISICIYRIVVFVLTKLMDSLYQIENNSMKYEMIHSQNDLLNNYLLLFITLILKALHFEDADKDLIDALFYSINILAMVSTVRQKANEIGVQQP